MKTITPFNLFDEIFDIKPEKTPIKTLSDMGLMLPNTIQSKSYYIKDHSENEVLYRFVLPGVSKNNLSVKYYPDEDVIRIHGKVIYECSINESDKNLDNEINYTIKLYKKYDPESPLTTLLKDGILYLKFGTKQNSQTKEYTIT